MTLEKGAITEADLHAYVDGALDEGRRSDVDAFLVRHLETADEIAAWRQQNEILCALYGHVSAEPIPAHLHAAYVAQEAWAEWKGRLRIAVAAMVLLALGAAAGWYGRGQFAGMPLAREALVDEAMAAHNLYAGEVAHPVEVGASREAHLVSWLSKRLGRALSVPDLRALGFDLVGGRLLPAAGRPAAQFMYEDEAGNRITLYIVPASDDRETAFRFDTDDGLESFSWTDDTISCALVGDVRRERLREIAETAYRQLS